MVWSEAKDLIMPTAAEGSREWGSAWQIHRWLLSALYVMEIVHGALLYPRQNDFPSQLHPGGGGGGTQQMFG